MIQQNVNHLTTECSVSTPRAVKHAVLSNVFKSAEERRGQLTAHKRHMPSQQSGLLNTSSADPLQPRPYLVAVLQVGANLCSPCPGFRSHYLSGVELDQHRGVRLQVFHWNGEPEVVEKKELQLEMV